MSNSHKELRDSLARWFGDVADARRLAREAGLDLSRIDFSGSARTIWFHVLEEAARVARVDALRALGAQECPSESAFGGGPASDRGGGAGGRAARPLPLSLLLVASAADRELLGGLERALRPLLGEGLIRIDTTTDVAPGEDRHAALSCMIEEAEVIVPLVSSDLFVCEEWGAVERAFARGEEGPRVVPVLARASLLPGSMRGLRCLPPSGRPIAAHADRDEALTDVASALGAMARERRGLLRGDNPFPGLLSYGRGAETFWGREEEVARWCRDLSSLPAVSCCFGPSGSGKTSFFNAGLAPAIEALGGHRCVLSRLSSLDVDGARRLALDLAPAHGAAAPTLAEAIGAAARGDHLVWVIDQFEEVFRPSFDADAREALLRETLPAIARRFPAAVRVIVVVRSDELHQLHPYDAALPGLFKASRRLPPLDRAAAARVVHETFRAGDVALTADCIEATVERACASAEGSERGRPYLPYLQLLGMRFYAWLTRRGPRRHALRGAVARTTLERFLGDRDLFVDYLHESVLELLQVEPRHALVLRLFDLLIEGERRARLRRARIPDHFADPERVDDLLRRLGDRRLVQFDEASESYELVHDALVVPLRGYVDAQRRDYGREEFLAAAQRFLTLSAPPRALAENLVLHALRSGLPVCWIETRIPHLPTFYDRLAERCPPDARPLVLRRLAAAHQRAGSVPAAFPAARTVAMLCAARDLSEAEALLEVLSCSALDGDAWTDLKRWLDPSPGAGPPWRSASPQELGWHSATTQGLRLLLGQCRGRSPQIFDPPACDSFNSVAVWRAYWSALFDAVAAGQADVGEAMDVMDLSLRSAQDAPRAVSCLVAELSVRPPPGRAVAPALDARRGAAAPKA